MEPPVTGRGADGFVDRCGDGSQKEWNQVAADGVTQQKLQTTFGDAGAKMWSDLTDKINANAAAAGNLAEQQQQLQSQQQLMGTIGSDVSDVLSSGFIGLADHQGGSGFDSALHGLGESLIRSDVSSITSSIFGGGKAGGGLLGGLLGGLFGGGGGGGHGGTGHNATGTADWRGGPTIVGEQGPELVDLPEHAQVISNSALGSMRAPAGHTIHVGGPTITIQGDVSERNRAEIMAAVKEGQRETLDHITRNLGQIQSDNAQYS